MSVPAGEVRTPGDTVWIGGKEHAWCLPLDVRALRQALAGMLCAARRYSTSAPSCVELMLVRDGDMACCNSDAMGCVGPTNILSFPPGDAEQGGLEASDNMPDMPGSLILSVDAVWREAFLFRQEPQEHLLRLLAHGMGHLCGLDHGPEMDSLCDNILNSQ
ncbi:MAG TPA: rRNA maturation RNase YbeY [Candidatus Avidesulfovibrio excrementigallinarum]|nr:rRNA maturation RNase YbeY [Candidatus Avidesulfovibrio excrementigallinarum]